MGQGAGERAQGLRPTTLTWANMDTLPRGHLTYPLGVCSHISCRTPRDRSGGIVLRPGGGNQNHLFPASGLDRDPKGMGPKSTEGPDPWELKLHRFAILHFIPLGPHPSDKVMHLTRTLQLLTPTGSHGNLKNYLRFILGPSPGPEGSGPEVNHRGRTLGS